MAYTNLKLYEKLNDFLKENGYSLCRQLCAIDKNYRVYKVTYKTDADALEKNYKTIEFHSNKRSKDGSISKLIFRPFSNYFRLEIGRYISIDFHKVNEFFMWFNTYKNKFEQYNIRNEKYEKQIRALKDQLDQIRAKQRTCDRKFEPLVKKFKEEQEHRWKFDKENYKMKRILSKLD